MMLPNDYHPGPRCSCPECLRRYPDNSLSKYDIMTPRKREERAAEWRAMRKEHPERARACFQYLRSYWRQVRQEELRS